MRKPIQKKVAPTGITVGSRVCSNEALAKLFTPPASQWKGTVIGEGLAGANTWKVRVDGAERIQTIHEKFLEVIR